MTKILNLLAAPPAPDLALLEMVDGGGKMIKKKNVGYINEIIDASHN